MGFQTKLTHPAQERVFRLIPALARARFARLGSIHRNTFLDAPRLLDRQLRLRAAPHLRVAGQLSGVEGYVESAASGLLAAIFAVGQCRRREIAPPPPETALGGLLAHLANTTTPDFQPSNVIRAPAATHRQKTQERQEAGPAGSGAGGPGRLD